MAWGLNLNLLNEREREIGGERARGRQRKRERERAGEPEHVCTGAFLWRGGSVGWRSRMRHRRWAGGEKRSEVKK